MAFSFKIPTLSNVGGQNNGLFGYGGGLSGDTIGDVGGAVSDIFGGFADQAKAKGDMMEAANYDLAAKFAGQNIGFTEQSTAVKEAQLDRSIYQGLGSERADVSGAGFTQGGSSIYLLRDSASQGALTKQVAATQGLITEAGYQEQEQSYQDMSAAARDAADAENKAATGAFISGAIKGVASIATLL